MDAEVRAWVEDALSAHGLVRTGEIVTVKRRAWATVLRAPTSGGDVYFKANAPGGRHEPALARALAEEWPDRVPAPLAVDPERGWMLTADHGPCLRETPEAGDLAAVWEALLPRYAELQLGSAREPERWLALGVPDRRLEKLSALTRELLHETADLSPSERAAMLALLPVLEESCHRLAELPACAALEHGDLHEGNVLVGRGRRWLFDWADASVSHPFHSLLVTCNMAAEELESDTGRRAAARLRDAYLEPWTPLAPARVLRERFPVALWVAHVGRALDWDHILRGSRGPDQAEWEPRIALWLRRWLARRAWVEPGVWP